MGRRSRKRARRPVERPDPVHRSDPPSPAVSPGHAPRSRRRRGDAPPAPWGSFPLVEICILIAIILGVVGFITWGPRGRVMLIAAAGLGSLAGLELSVREHLAGYRSHTTVLAATAAVAALAALFFAHAQRGVLLGVGGAIFAVAFYLLRELFRRRSGGLGFRA